MNEIDIIQQIKSGEVSKMQFKEGFLTVTTSGANWWHSAMHVVEHWSLV